MRLHWIARVFASAIARRLAYVCVAILLGWCGISRAEAKEYATQGAAYAGCISATQAYLAARNTPKSDSNPRCVILATGNKFYQGMFSYKPCDTCTAYDVEVDRHSWLAGCDSEPSYTGAGPWGSYIGTARSGSIGCRNGCDGVWFGNADDTMTWQTTGAVCPEDPPKTCEGMKGYVWNRYLGVCEPKPPEKCPEGQSKNAKGTCEPNACPEGMVLGQDGTCKQKDNECPAGRVKSPSGGCLPGDGQCAKGEIRGKDGTCKRDGDGDGDPDDGEDDGTAKENFSGGDDCSSPPSCSGSLIMCGQARIQWRIDCNTRKNRNISGGACAAMPVCTGEKCDAMEYSQLLMQWRSACAAEKLLAKGDGTGSGQPDWTKVSGDGTGGAGADPEKPHRTVALGVGMLDSSGFLGGGGACPKFGSVSLGKYGSIDLDQWNWICQFFAAVRMVFIALGSFIAFTILGGRSIF
ncbi:hypothetical protein XpiCFBP4643_16020 [Xanthomonas pisi]|uniref:Uncharacterized protein n=1 Tax=Xanthomonas pisi TaxID=56457 RepID=A0A2S7D0Q1_9XANT|nr:hypothetical protein [Xanthomonas pisi]PPU67294.1 hypothetical protein XpiCFBP4643_16020 [Xanthomonas pisi]